MRNPRLTGTSLAQTKKGTAKKNMRSMATENARGPRCFFLKNPQLAPDFIFYCGDIAACNKKMKAHSLFSQRLV